MWLVYSTNNGAGGVECGLFNWKQDGEYNGFSLVETCKMFTTQGNFSPCYITI